VVCAAPVFLVGALAVQVRDSLAIGPGPFGMVVAAYFLGAGISASYVGRSAERLGGLRTMRAAVAATAALLLLGASCSSALELGAVMLAAGVSSSALQPAANLFLARRIPPGRQGLAFGAKQSAVPLASLLAGLSVPALALTVGWRWAFVAAAVAAAVVAVMLPRPTVSLRQQRASSSRQVAYPGGRLPLLILTVGFAMGIATASALGAFLATSAVHSGVSKGSAGLLVAMGGLVAVGARLGIGLVADRRPSGHLGVVSAMLAVGSLGYLGLALADSKGAVWLYLPAVVLVYGVGWGWNGLFSFAVVSHHRKHPGAATGFTQTGGRLGGVLGPLLFGQVLAHHSYALAWAIAAIVAALGAGVIFTGTLLMARRQPAAPAVALD